MQRLEVHYRWQITEFELLTMRKYPVWPAIIVDDVILKHTYQIDEFLKEHSISFEEFIERVPDGYNGTTNILS